MSTTIETIPEGGACFRLGDRLVEPRLNRLTRDGVSIQIEIKAMDVLLCLARRAGEVVTRQEIVDAVWATEFISDNTLTHAVAELRNALGDDARTPTFIETIHRRGYRLITAVEPAAPEDRATATVARFPVSKTPADDARNPYPGLAAFTESDAEFFFGREAEVAALWRKLTTRRLLAVIGPSGVGKSSLLRAGLIPAAPEGWEIRICQPGEAPFSALARALSPDFSDDPEALAALFELATSDAGIAVIAAWRARHDQALLIVDQFEELFTQSPPEIQTRFAELLGRLAREADIHVLLSMRDDFVYRCHAHGALKPIFDALTPIAQPAPEALARAVSQPARRCGYAFDDDGLVDEMVREVAEERAALPLLAFTAARLWEERDRDKSLLTHEAYRRIGGIHGALAGHAEATVAAIGAGRLPVVREIFRNLVTAEGTRATREVDDLLSVFTDAAPAGEVLAALVDARLLTSYEATDDDGARRTVEIVHESLLAAWPRLVRWQAQDAEGALLRDQLRQAARTWHEHHQSDDLLWAGSAYREFAVWRERYPGGLSEVEEAFATAMTEFAGRRRRRRQIAYVVALAAVVLVVGALGTMLRRSIVSERMAEAQKLVALGKVRLEDYPTAALAHATQSLELADNQEARLLALEALWEGPTAFVVNDEPTVKAAFSPGGDWLAQSHDFTSSLAVISRDGRQRILDHPSASGTTRVYASFGGREDLFYSWGEFADRGRIALWSATDGRLLASARPVEDPHFPQMWFDFPNLGMIGLDEGKPTALFVMAKENTVTVDALGSDGVHRKIGEIRTTKPVGQGGSLCIPRESGEWFGLVDGEDVSVVKVGDDELSDPILLGRDPGGLYPMCEADPLGRFLVTANQSGEIRLWDSTAGQSPAVIDGPRNMSWFSLSNHGSLLHVSASAPDGTGSAWVWSIDDLRPSLLRRIDRVRGFQFIPESEGPMLAGIVPGEGCGLYSLRAPAGAEPIVLRSGPAAFSSLPEFSPDGRWLAKPDNAGLTLWPLVRSYPAVILLGNGVSGGVAFGPDGRFLATSVGTTVTTWPLEGAVPPPGHVIFEADTLQFRGMAVSPNGEWFAAGSRSGHVWIGKDNAAESQRLPDPTTNGSLDVAFSHDGRLVAALTGFYDLRSAVVRVWDVKTSAEVAVLKLSEAVFRRGCSFTDDGRLLTGTSKGVVAWNLQTGDHEVLVAFDVGRFVASDDGHRLLMTRSSKAGYMQDPAGSPVFFDLDTGVATTLATHGLQVVGIALDRDGKVAVTADRDGVIRVGSVTGDEPQLLLGHDGDVYYLAVDPRGRWIASGGEDRTVRLWPMPDLSKPPLHALPREELIAKLKSLTNVRLVRVETSGTGWKLTHDPFPGWREVPTW